MAKLPAREQYLEEQQLVMQLSAYNNDVGAAAAASSVACKLAAGYGVAWTSPAQLELLAPAHPDYLEPGATRPTPLVMGVVKGGKLGWVLGEGRVSNWYDHPLEVDVDPKLDIDDPDNLVETQHMLVVRPRKPPPVLVDHVHTVSFARSYPGGEPELVYTHATPFVLQAYGFRSCGNYARADPRSWRLEAEAGDGSWVGIHAVTNFHFSARRASVLFYTSGNTVAAAKYRLVVTEMKAMVALLHLADFVLYKVAVRAGGMHDAGASPAGASSGAGSIDTADEDVVPVAHKEAAHVTLRLKPREAAGGQVRLTSYCVRPHSQAQLYRGSAPTAWALEGLTSDY